MNEQTAADPAKHPTSWYLKLVVVGMVCGLLTGIFGIGGGIVMVPALVLVMKLDQRLAAGTSLAAILPSVTVGFVGYALNGHVDYIAGLLLAVGIIVGAQIGSLLLSRIRSGILQWMFIGFLALTALELFLSIPSRDGAIDMSGAAVAALIALGLGTGILSGMLGVGGGVVVVPMLIVFFGASDLIAKGASLMMMIPGALSGTIGNLRRSNVNLRATIVLGASASSVTWVGAIIATLLTPLASNVLFACFLVIVAIRMALHRVRSR